MQAGAGAVLGVPWCPCSPRRSSQPEVRGSHTKHLPRSHESDRNRRAKFRAFSCPVSPSPEGGSVQGPPRSLAGTIQVAQEDGMSNAEAEATGEARRGIHALEPLADDAQAEVDPRTSRWSSISRRLPGSWRPPRRSSRSASSAWPPSAGCSRRRCSRSTRRVSGASSSRTPSHRGCSLGCGLAPCGARAARESIMGAALGDAVETTKDGVG